MCTLLTGRKRKMNVEIKTKENVQQRAKYNDDRMSSQPAHTPDTDSGAGWLAAGSLNTGFFASASLTSPLILFS